MKIAIAIPVYKPDMSADEERSFLQCQKILQNYDTYLVCPNSLNTSKYEQVSIHPLHDKRFKPSYFKGLEGYNRLMKSHEFYNRFRDYDYLLIYQLDAWVFSDELEMWCNKGYDYIGSPWFEHQEGAAWSELVKTKDGHYKLWLTGNGGLSLRKVSAFMDVTRRFRRVKTCHEVFQEEYHSLADLGHCLLRCCGPLIGTNSMRHFIETQTKFVWEDAFFCHTLGNTRFRLSIPSPEEAAFFSFECMPAYLYEYVTKGRLPFGCHAWRKYQYEEFWHKFI